MNWLLLANPTSGGGKGARVKKELVDLLNAQRISFRDISGTSYESARTNLRLAIEESEDGALISGVFVVGGDGIVHLAIQELALREIPLAVIPAGTGNDFARVMKIPLQDVKQTLEGVLRQEPIAIDLGRVSGEYFADILSTGFDSVVNERANRMTRIKGQMKYNISILLELPLFKPRNYQFKIDGKEFDVAAMLIAIGNGSSYGGGMLVCPDADITDGHFDVMILRPVSKIEFLKVFPKVFSGAHVSHPAVDIFRGKKVDVAAEAVAYADGERIGPLPISAEVIPQALKSWRF